MGYRARNDSVIKRLDWLMKVLTEAQDKVQIARAAVHLEEIPKMVSPEMSEEIIARLLTIRNLLHYFSKVVGDLREEVIVVRIEIENGTHKK